MKWISLLLFFQSWLLKIISWESVNNHILDLFEICQHWLVLGIIDVHHLDWKNWSYKNVVYINKNMIHKCLIKLSGWSITTACKVQASIINKIDSVWLQTDFTFIQIKYTFGAQIELFSWHIKDIMLFIHSSTQPL